MNHNLFFKKETNFQRREKSDIKKTSFKKSNQICATSLNGSITPKKIDKSCDF